jgi:steroid 5-alpha reductase family enzyme
MFTDLLIAFAAILVAACAVMTAAWVAGRSLDNYSLADPVWTGSFVLLAGLAAAALDGWAPRQMLLVGLVAFWSIRLGTHLLVRFIGHHPEEDGRYAQLRQEWDHAVDGRMFSFFLMQAGAAAGLAIPFLFAAAAAAPHFVFWDLLGAALVIIGVVGEGLADRQLASFKRQSTQRGAVCRVGLWSWSRHPNYFFEFFAWCGFGALALAAPWGFVGLLSPAIILYLLLKVTGIPATEEQAVRTKGEAYRRYQAEVSRFVPLPPKLQPARNHFN